MLSAFHIPRDQRCFFDQARFLAALAASSPKPSAQMIAVPAMKTVLLAAVHDNGLGQASLLVGPQDCTLPGDVVSWNDLGMAVNRGDSPGVKLIGLMHQPVGEVARVWRTPVSLEKVKLPSECNEPIYCFAPPRPRFPVLHLGALTLVLDESPNSNGYPFVGTVWVGGRQFVVVEQGEPEDLFYGIDAHLVSVETGLAFLYSEETPIIR